VNQCVCEKTTILVAQKRHLQPE